MKFICCFLTMTTFLFWSSHSNAFGGQIEDAAVEYFEGVVKDDNIPINMEVPQKPELLVDYIDGWRMKIWEQGYSGILKGATYFKKGDSFHSTEGSSQAVRRVLFRLVKRTINFELFSYFMIISYCNY